MTDHLFTLGEHMLDEKGLPVAGYTLSGDAVYERAHPPGFRWLHESFGTNWRML